jgi:hypothetical protein
MQMIDKYILNNSGKDGFISIWCLVFDIEVLK